MTLSKTIHLFVTIKSLTFRRRFVRDTVNKHAILCVEPKVSIDVNESVLELQYYEE